MISLILHACLAVQDIMLTHCNLVSEGEELQVGEWGGGKPASTKAGMSAADASLIGANKLSMDG